MLTKRKKLDCVQGVQGDQTYVLENVVDGV